MPNPRHKLTLKPTLKPKLKVKPRPKLLLKPMPNPRHKPKLKREAKPERKVWLIPHTKPMPHISLRFATLRFTELHWAEYHILSTRMSFTLSAFMIHHHPRIIQWITLTRVGAEHLSIYHINPNRIVHSIYLSINLSLDWNLLHIY